jgi:hypothetical protein
MVLGHGAFAGFGNLGVVYRFPKPFERRTFGAELSAPSARDRNRRMSLELRLTSVPFV